MSLNEYFLSKGVSTEEAGRLSESLLKLHPWLDFDEEVSESIGLELFDDGNIEWPASANAPDFLDWYNGVVIKAKMKGRRGPSLDAYDELCTVVGAFGTESAFGDGDFWVVDESFSGKNISIISNRAERLPEGMVAAIEAWKSQRNDVESVLISDEDGRQILLI